MIDLIKILIEFNGEKITDFVLIDIRSFDYLLFRRNLCKKFFLVIILTPTIDTQRTSIESENLLDNYIVIQ